MVASQLGALGHRVEHLGAQDGGLPHSACELCAGYAQFSAAAPAHIAPLAVPSLEHALVAIVPVGVSLDLALAYSIRGPPALS